MNKTEEIMKCAIEGGWNRGVDPRIYGNWETYKYQAMCDPKFFQAIGKAKGWDKKKWIEMGTVNKSVAEFGKVLSEDKYHALRFHEINLTQSFDDAIDYLYNLIK